MSVYCSNVNCGHDYRYHDSDGCNFVFPFGRDGCTCTTPRSFIQPEEYDDGQYYSGAPELNIIK